jgi:hypothetical protein
MARRLRQVVDLYTTGQVVTLRDGTPVWVQPLNPFEADTARNEAQVAKTRITMAIREFGSEEQQRVREYFMSDGVDGARLRLIEAKTSERMARIFDGIRNDPEWSERLQIIERGAEQTAPFEPEEEKLLIKLTEDYTDELTKRIDNERQFQTETYEHMDEDALWDEYLQWFIDRRAGEKMMAEYRTHQVLYGVRVCEGRHIDHDEWDHSECNSHQEKLFADKDEVRNSPEVLLDLLFAACEDVDMSAREAKNSDRQGSSSDSSPLPSAAAESTASTQDETPVAPPGSSPSPSDTRSPSLAGAS